MAKPSDKRSSLGAQIRDAFGGLSSYSFQVTVANDEPRSYQALIKFRDANKPWATGIDKDPDKAMLKALKAAKKQSKGSTAKSKEYFHRSRSRAEKVAKSLEKKLVERGKALAIRVQFEPYRGFIVVVFVSPVQHDQDLREYMTLKGEIRETHPGQSFREEDPKLRQRKEGVVKKTPGKKPTTPLAAKEGGKGTAELETMNGKELREEFKRRYGKQPNSRVIKGVEALRQHLIKEQQEGVK